MSSDICKYPGCGRPVYKDGVCAMMWHNQREVQERPLLMVDGLSISEYAEAHDLKRATVYDRIYRGVLKCSNQ